MLRGQARVGAQKSRFSSVSLSSSFFGGAIHFIFPPKYPRPRIASPRRLSGHFVRIRVRIRGILARQNKYGQIGRFLVRLSKAHSRSSQAFQFISYSVAGPAPCFLTRPSSTNRLRCRRAVRSSTLIAAAYWLDLTLPFVAIHCHPFCSALLIEVRTSWPSPRVVASELR